MAKKLSISLGSRSQSHSKYGSSAGKQCTGMCLGFAVYSDKIDPGKLKRRDLDNILDIGNDIYEACSTHYESEILAGDELPTHMTYDGVRYKVGRGQMRYGFIQDFRNLTFQATNVFCTYTQTIFICKGYSVMLKYVGGRYYLFDSHKKNKFGSKCADGKASVIRFNTFSEMLRYLSQLFHSDTREQYDIVPIHLKVELAKAGSSRDIRCFFARKQGYVLHQYESDVLQMSSDDSNLHRLSDAENRQDSFQTYRKRKLPSMVSSDYESDMANAKRIKPNASTCVLGLDNSVLYVDDNCTEKSHGFTATESKLSDSQNLGVPAGTKPKIRQLHIKKIGNGWCVVKSDTNPSLRQKDKKQIEVLQSGLSFPHGTVLRLVKESGTWSVQRKTKQSCMRHVFEDKTNDSNIKVGTSTSQPLKPTSVTRGEQTSFPVGKENVSPTNLKKKRNKRIKLSRLESDVEKQNVVSKENIADESDLSECFDSETSQSYNLGKRKHAESGKRILSQNPRAVKQRQYRALQRAQQVSLVTCELSQNPKAVRQRNYRARKKAENLSSQISDSTNNNVMNSGNNGNSPISPKNSQNSNVTALSQGLAQVENDSDMCELSQTPQAQRQKKSVVDETSKGINILTPVSVQEKEHLYNTGSQNNEGVNSKPVSKRKRALSMTPSAIKQRAHRAKKKLLLTNSETQSAESDVGFIHDENSVDVDSIVCKSQKPTAKRMRELRSKRKSLEKQMQVSTDDEEVDQEARYLRIRRNNAQRVRNFRISRSKTPLYGAPIFRNNNWMVNNHYGNPCAGSTPSMDIISNDLTLEVPNDTVETFTCVENETDVEELVEHCTDQNETDVQEQVEPCTVDSDYDVDGNHVNLMNFEMGNEDLEDENVLVEGSTENIEIPMFKIVKLSETVDHVCVFCTKLCFPEQGKYYSGIYLEKYKQYLSPNFCENRVFICSSCKSQISRGNAPKFNVYNGIHWPKKVIELDLLNHEERLIALRLPFMHIQILPSGGQRSLKGNVINVPADIHETIYMLPRHINDQGTVSVKLKRRLCYQSVYQDSNVRPEKILEALRYLKTNSSYYQLSNLQISDTWLSDTIEEINNTGNMVANNGDLDAETERNNSDTEVLHVHENTAEGAYEADKSASDDNFSEVDRTEIPAILDTMLDIIPRNVTLNVAPGEGQRPLHLLYDQNGEVMSFPTIYCGKSIDEIYPPRFNYLQRTRWELTTEDRRAAQKTELIFYKYKMYQLDFIKEQGKLAMRLLKHDKEYTAKDLRTDEQRNGIATVDDGFFFYRKLRNSPQYLQQKKRELFATIRQLGIPTFFVSLSAADTKWPELLQSLGQIVDGKTYSFEQIENMSFSERTRLVNSDPVTCARYFDRRFHFFLNHIVYKSPHPLGQITDHFYRIEFQHRGSPHVHMILFSSHAPKYNKEMDNEAVIEYIDKYISCSLEPREEAKPYINYQVHKHSKTCRKGGRATCRFHYPLPPFERTVILRPNPDKTPEQKDQYIEIQRYLDSNAINENTVLADILMHFDLTYEDYELVVRSSINNPKVFLKRKPNECRVNMYMSNLLHVWKANIDCQFCLDPYSVVSYIVNYINKENRGLSLNLASVTRECEVEKKSIRETIKKLGNVFLNTSEISVQECVYVLLGMHLTHQSVDVILLNSATEEKRVKLVKSSIDLQGVQDDSTEIFQDSQYDTYQKRPDYFKDWTFADYLTIVRISPRTAKSKQVEAEGIHVTKRNTRYYLDSEKRYSIGRKRILSFYCPRKAQDEEEYYRIHLLLFHPWNREPKTDETCSTYNEMYRNLLHSELDDLHDVAQSYSLQNLETLQDLYENLTNDVSNLVVAPGVDQNNAEDLEVGPVSLTSGNFFRPTTETLHDTGSGSLEHAVNTEQETVDTLWPHEQICANIVNLNTGQRHIFDYVMSAILSGENILRLFITGGAGAGKTFLLHAIDQAVSRFYNLQPLNNQSACSVLKVAPTGKAAFLIRGQTIHTGLGIKPANSYEFYQRLSADHLNTLQVKLRGIKVLMIDEISMVGLNFFRFINIRLQDIKANDEPFGGLHVICLGDLYQLPPVREKWIFENNERGLSSLEINIWTEHFQLYELTEIMRQREEYQFAELLNRMRVGKLIPSDYLELQKQVVPHHESNDGLDCLHIFSTNDAANNYNRVCFNKSNGEKDVVSASDSITEVVSNETKRLIVEALSKKNEFGGLCRSLALGVGLTYDITQNLNVQDGLFNGTSGVLKFIQYMTGYEKPVALWFLFEDALIGRVQRRVYSHYRNDEISNLWTPVFAITREFKLHTPKSTIRRKQFPLHQSTGKTIHKSQGCTLPEIAIQLSDFTHRNGFYVACSRVPKLSQLHIINFAPNQILTDKKVEEEMQRLQRERLLVIVKDVYPKKDKWFNIYYCNIQSLLIHVKYLQKDQMALSSNIMLFNETHLTPHDLDVNINIDGFECYRFDSEVTANGRRPYNGLVVYVRSFFEVHVVRKYRAERFEYMLCEIKTEWHTLTVALVYIKPKTSHVHVVSMFEHIFQNDLNRGTVSVIGDFNLDTQIPQNRLLMQNIGIEYNLFWNKTSPTTNKKTTIDHCLSSEATTVLSRYVPWSYHTALTFQF